MPWEEIIGNQEYEIAIAPIVVAELDKHKNSPSKKISKKAKSIIAKFHKIIDEPGNGGVKVLDKRATDLTFERNHLLSTDPDDNLLASILDFGLQSGDEAILITNDLGAKMKAKSLGVNFIIIPEQYRLDEELDETEKKLQSTQKELEELKYKLPKVSLNFKNGANQLRIIPAKVKINPQEFFEQGAKEIRRKHTPLELEIKNPGFTGVFPFRVSATMLTEGEKQIKEHNSKLQKFYSAYDSYLRDMYRYAVYLTFCLEIELVLDNAGTSPAEDIDVNLQFPDRFKLVEELKEVPEEPKAPHKPKNILDFERIFPILDFKKLTDEIPPPQTLPAIRKLGKTSHYNVEIKAGDLKHNQTILLPKLYACYESIESMESFHIDYTLMISNIPKKIEGKLHVIITREQE
jgi:rRNA-processing protein FCF1